MYTSFMLSLALTVAAPIKEEPKKEMPKLTGDWVVDSIVGPEKKDAIGVKFTFTDDKVSIFEPQRKAPEEANYTADYKKKIAEIDIRPGRAAAAGMPEVVVKGIFEIKDDTLKIVFSHGPGAERPTEFKGDADKGIMLIVLKRVKAEK
jgi:uncharacterized protein (TIGR03067 family)